MAVAKTDHFTLYCNALSSGKNLLDKNNGRARKTDAANADRGHMRAAVNGLVPTVRASIATVQPGFASLFPIEDIWWGAVVPKRLAKRAVTRNAIKRQIYTICAGFSALYPKAAFVVRLRREFSRQQFFSASSTVLKEAVRREVMDLMHAGLSGK